MRFYDADGKLFEGGPVAAKRAGGKPSVTTVLDVLAKPGVEYWKQDKLLDAAFKTAFDALHGPLKTWKTIVKRKARKATSAPASIGTKYHEEIAGYLNGDILNFSDLNYVPAPTMEAIVGGLEERGIEIESLETTIVGHIYAGTIDLIGSKDGKRVIVDWKTQDDPLKCYRSWGYQLGGYSGLVNDADPAPDCRLSRVDLGYNVVISRKTPGEVKWFKWKHMVDLEYAFMIVYNAWDLEHGYNDTIMLDPEEE